jgi:hypothetical protein
MRLPVPAFACNQTISFTKVYQSQTDMYGKPLEDEPITINNCIAQLETQYSGTNSNRQLLANGVVFLYAEVSTPFPTLTKDNLQSKITYESNEYTVNTIDEYQQPDGSGLFGYRLGVL